MLEMQTQVGTTEGALCFQWLKLEIALEQSGNVEAKQLLNLNRKNFFARCIDDIIRMDYRNEIHEVLKNQDTPLLHMKIHVTNGSFSSAKF